MVSSYYFIDIFIPPWEYTLWLLIRNAHWGTSSKYKQDGENKLQIRRLFHPKSTDVVGTHKKCHAELHLLGIHNICFGGEVRKILFGYSVIWRYGDIRNTLFSLNIETPYLLTILVIKYCIYHMYWDSLSTYHTCPKIWNSPFYYLLMCLKYCCMYGKQCRPWSDAAWCGVWSESVLFAKVSLSQYLGLLQLLQ